jgi:hypothetical protein
MWDGLSNSDERRKATTNGLCGPWIPGKNMKVYDEDNNKKISLAELAILTGDVCQGSTSPDCEMYKVSNKPLACITCVGLPCTYQGQGSRQCLHPLSISNGTTDVNVLENLAIRGSRGAEFYGRTFSVNKALGALQYLTDLNYNRLSRNPLCFPPPREKTSACLALATGLAGSFDPTTDDLDQLIVDANDLGNSGGLDRDVKFTRSVLDILSEAVNDRPRIKSPLDANVIEDWPFSFINQDLIGTAGLALPAPKFYAQFLDDQWSEPHLSY